MEDVSEEDDDEATFSLTDEALLELLSLLLAAELGLDILSLSLLINPHAALLCVEEEHESQKTFGTVHCDL